MKFVNLLRSGKRPRCVDCIYFDRKLFVQPGAALAGVKPDKGKLVEVQEGDNTGICRYDAPGPAVLGGWMKLIDGTQTYCAKGEDGQLEPGSGY